MQGAWLFPVSVLAITTLVISCHGQIPRLANQDRLPSEASGVDLLAAAQGSTGGADGASSTLEPYARGTTIDAVSAWSDPELGLSFAYPAGWKPVQPIETEIQAALLEPGYAIGFESPKVGDDDPFADYIMIEILPGRDSGAFSSDGSQRRGTLIDGRLGWRDVVLVEADERDSMALDLVVHQAEFSGLGYTVGLYAIGQGKALPLLADAFELLLRTFHLSREPYPVS